MKCDECSSAVCKHIHALDGYETYAIDQFTIGVRPSWINVTNRLPEPDVMVLTYGNHVDGVKIGYIVSEVHPPLWSRVLYDDQCKITHWMPLPSTESITGVGEWTTFGI